MAVHPEKRMRLRINFETLVILPSFAGQACYRQKTIVPGNPVSLFGCQSIYPFVSARNDPRLIVTWQKLGISLSEANSKRQHDRNGEKRSAYFSVARKFRYD
jgi:hypothetical protein